MTELVTFRILNTSQNTILDSLETLPAVLLSRTNAIVPHHLQKSLGFKVSFG